MKSFSGKDGSRGKHKSNEESSSWKPGRICQRDIAQTSKFYSTSARHHSSVTMLPNTGTHICGPISTRMIWFRTDSYYSYCLTLGDDIYQRSSRTRTSMSSTSDE